MTYIIHTDGGARGNPGPAATGIVIEFPGKKIEKGYFLGTATNNVAEYSAVKQALEFLLKEMERGEVAFFLDSELVVKQLTGVYKIKDHTLQKLAGDIQSKMKEWGRVITFTHVPRNQNKEADAMVNKVLDQNLNISSHV
jgi:ribonuclease HI